MTTTAEIIKNTNKNIKYTLRDEAANQKGFPSLNWTP